MNPSLKSAAVAEAASAVAEAAVEYSVPVVDAVGAAAKKASSAAVAAVDAGSAAVGYVASLDPIEVRCCSLQMFLLYLSYLYTVPKF